MVRSASGDEGRNYFDLGTKGLSTRPRCITLITHSLRLRNAGPEGVYSKNSQGELLLMKVTVDINNPKQAGKGLCYIINAELLLTKSV
jgi:hypothetical protein